VLEFLGSSLEEDDYDEEEYCEIVRRNSKDSCDVIEVSMDESGSNSNIWSHNDKKNLTAQGRFSVEEAKNLDGSKR